MPPPTVPPSAFFDETLMREVAATRLVAGFRNGSAEVVQKYVLVDRNNVLTPSTAQDVRTV